MIISHNKNQINNKESNLPLIIKTIMYKYLKITLNILKHTIYLFRPIVN